VDLSQVLSNNLLSPIPLAFALGIFAKLIKSEFSLPKDLYASLSILKLASGMSAAHRLKDLADVLELVKAAKLPLELGASLDASVRARYEELWHAAQVYDPISES